MVWAQSKLASAVIVHPLYNTSTMGCWFHSSATLLSLDSLPYCIRFSAHQAAFSALPSLPIGRHHAFLPRPHPIRIPVSKAFPAGLPHLHSPCYSLSLTPFCIFLSSCVLLSLILEGGASDECQDSFPLRANLRVARKCARPISRLPSQSMSPWRIAFQGYFPLSPRKSLLSRMLNLPYGEVKIS